MLMSFITPVYGRKSASVSNAVSVLALVFFTAACADIPSAQVQQPAAPQAQPLLNAKPCAGTLPASGALVRADDDASFGLGLVCSGTLIRPDVVLTAAHCFGDPDPFADLPKQAALYFTTAKSLQAAQTHEVFETAGFVQHPGYISGDTDLLLREPRDAAEQSILDRMHDACGVDGAPQGWSITDHVMRAFNRMTPEMMTAEKRWYECVRDIDDDGVKKALGSLLYDDPAQDIALVFLKQPIKGIEPAQLPEPSSEVQLGRVHPMSGYGRHAQSDDKIIAKNSGHKNCGSATFTGATKTEFGYDSGSPLACFGDSGGGAFVSREPGSVIIGVLSRGDVLPFSMRCRGEGVLTKVSAYVPWIVEELRKRDIAAL